MDKSEKILRLARLKAKHRARLRAVLKPCLEAVVAEFGQEQTLEVSSFVSSKGRV